MELCIQQHIAPQYTSRFISHQFSQSWIGAGMSTKVIKYTMTNYTISFFLSYSQALGAPSTPQLYPFLTRKVLFTSDFGIGKREGQKKKKKEIKVQDFP